MGKMSLSVFVGEQLWRSFAAFKSLYGSGLQPGLKKTAG